MIRHGAAVVNRFLLTEYRATMRWVGPFETLTLAQRPDPHAGLKVMQPIDFIFRHGWGVLQLQFDFRSKLFCLG